MNGNWHGIMKILEITHKSKDGVILWQDKNIYNMLHSTGEEYLLNILFAGGSFPDSYWFGLDNRGTLAATNEIGDISAEPDTINGYARIDVSTNGFDSAIQVPALGPYQSKSPILTFTADGGTIGPFKNLFLTTEEIGGILISSVALTSETTLEDGQSLALRMGMSLKDCP